MSKRKTQATRKALPVIVPDVVRTVWRVERYVPALGWEETLTSTEVGTEHEWDTTWPLAIPVTSFDHEQRAEDAAPTDAQVATLLQTHCLIARDTDTEVWSNGAEIRVTCAIDGTRIGTLYCVSHESLMPIVANESNDE